MLAPRSALIMSRNDSIRALSPAFIVTHAAARALRWQVHGHRHTVGPALAGAAKRTETANSSRPNQSVRKTVIGDGLLDRVLDWRHAAAIDRKPYGCHDHQNADAQRNP